MNSAAHPPAVSRTMIACAVAMYLLALFLTGCGRAEAATPADGAAFEMTYGHRFTFEGRVMANAEATDADAGIAFGVIPTSPIQSKPYYNVFTGMVENRPVAGNPHPIPVLRAAKVKIYREKPDVGRLALDRLGDFGSEATLEPESKFALATDGRANVRLLTLTTVRVPQDKEEQWLIAGTSESITLPDHIDDPVLDMGRAVEIQEPLPLTGRLVYGVRDGYGTPTEFRAIDLPGGKPVRLAEAVEGRIDQNGNLADRIDMNTVRVTSPHGKTLGEVKFERDEISEFAISPDGRRVAVSFERMVDVPDGWPKRQTVTAVYKVGGRKLGEFVGYDDPAFFPDGNRLVLTADNAGDGLFVGDLASGRVTPLVIHDGPGGDDHKPDWARRPVVSPDGRWMAYHQARDVYVVGTDGRGWTPVFNTPQHEPQGAPVFSPDSRYIAMIVVPLNVMHGPGRLSVFDVHKHVQQPIPAAAEANSDVPMTWMP